MQIGRTIILPDSLASIHLDSPIANHLAGWDSIRNDLEAIRQIADHIAETLDANPSASEVNLDGLTWTLIIRYARCFDSGRGRAAALGLGNVQKLGNRDFDSLHSGLIDRRHRTFAHAGDQCSVRTIVHLMPDDSFSLGFDEEGPGSINDPDQARLIASLCKSLLDEVDRKIEELKTKVMQETDWDAVRAKLKANLGTHANLGQQAVAALRATMGAPKDSEQ